MRAFLLFHFLVFWLGVASAQGQQRIEAEEGSIAGGDTATTLKGFSGAGYVEGIDSLGDYVEIEIAVPVSSQFKIEIGYLSNSPDDSKSILWVDGIPHGEIRTAFSEQFTVLNAGTLALSNGPHSLRLQFQSASLLVDYIVITPLADIPPFVLGEGKTRVEAEEGILLGTRVEFGALGYSGQGYASNFDSPDEDMVRILVEAAVADTYELSLGYAVPFGYKENYLSINGGPNEAIVFEDVDGFSTVSVGKISLAEGINTIEISHFWGFFILDYFEFNRVIGLPPLAIDQGNILLDDVAGDGFEIIRLDGTQSMDPDGEISEFMWSIEDTLIGSEPMIDFAFPTGTHFVDLSVEDNDGNRDLSSFSIIVADLDRPINNRVAVQQGKFPLFMSGINVAWTTSSNYAEDLLDYDEATWIEILDEVQSAGGNAIRWWLHTNGSQTPMFGSDGMVNGIPMEALENMNRVLDLAFERGIVVSLCLWSFDMLQNQGQNIQYTRALLEDSAATQAYIDHALIPMVTFLGHHPAIMTWEIFNEAEGMTTEFGWADQRTSMSVVQRFVNLCAGAIHRTNSSVPVSNGAWTLGSGSDSAGFFNYYRDDRLIAAGGDSLGTLDLIQVHYYGNLGTATSPFHYPASRWGVDKPIIIGEFPADGIEGYSIEECYEFAYRLGYAGALSWSYSDRQFGGLPASVPGIRNLFNQYPGDIIVPDSAVVSRFESDIFEQVVVYPNPALDKLNIATKDPLQITSFEIINIQGQIIDQGLISTQVSIQIPINGLHQGSYALRLHAGNKLANRIFIKL